jgi:hypothetical protein
MLLVYHLLRHSLGGASIRQYRVYFSYLSYPGILYFSKETQ